VIYVGLNKVCCHKWMSFAGLGAAEN
jgi:hypothetical protein